MYLYEILLIPSQMLAFTMCSLIIVIKKKMFHKLGLRQWLISKKYLVFLAEVLSKFPSTCQEAQTVLQLQIQGI